MNAVRSSTGWSRRPLGEDGHAGATRSRVFRSGQSPDRICSGGAGVVGKAGGCRVGWSVVLGDFVGAHLVLVYGDPETGAGR